MIPRFVFICIERSLAAEMTYCAFNDLCRLSFHHCIYFVARPSFNFVYFAMPVKVKSSSVSEQMISVNVCVCYFLWQSFVRLDNVLV